MHQNIIDDPEELVKAWDSVPKWVIVLATLPSLVFWLAVIILVTSPLIAWLMILTMGIPTLFLHHIFKRVCVLSFNQEPSIKLHFGLFCGLASVYLLVAIIYPYVH